VVRDSIKTAIILVNFNSAPDTIECIESLIKNLKSAYELVVVDNQSTDTSVKQIKNHIKQYKTSAVTLLVADENRGFAAGNNLGIEHGLLNKKISHFWLLNNDTIVKSDDLSPLVSQFVSMQSCGLLGSKLLYYNSPNTIQAVGGRIKVWQARVSLVGFNEEDIKQYDLQMPPIDYVVGASMFTSREVIDRVGKMNEKLFLYVEELDWCKRMKDVGFSITTCCQSVVYHKQGVSTRQFERGSKSKCATYYQIRNLIYHYRIFYPLLILSPVLRMFVRGILYSLTERQNFIKVYLKATMDAIKM
jgi:GT2 family glycosyltransferase